MQENNNVDFSIDLDKGLYIGEGINAIPQSNNSREKLFLNWKNLDRHLFVQGTTRVGKSRLMISMIRQCILKGSDVILIDPKGSSNNEFLSWINEFAIEANRVEDIKYLSPMDLKNSISFNPLYGLSNEEIASLISTLIPAKDDLYIVMGYTVTFAILNGLEFLEKIGSVDYPKRTLVTFEDIANYSSQQNLHSIFDKIKNTEEKEFNTTDKKEINKLNKLQKEAIHILSEQVDKNQSYFSKEASSFNTTIEQLSTGDIGEILCSTNKNPIIDDIKNKDTGLILLVESYPLKYKKASDAFIRTFFSMFTSLSSKLPKELFIFIDEAGSILYPGIEYLFNKSYGLGLKIMLFSQPISNYEYELGQELSTIINQNIQNNIYMSLSDIDLCQNISTSFGKEHLLKIGSDGNHSYDSFPLLQVRNLKKQEFIIQLNKKVYLGTTPNQSDYNYLLDNNDFNSSELNNIFHYFKDLVSDNILRKIVQKGLEDISKYDFQNNPSINKNAASDVEHLRSYFGNSFTLFENVNLRNHTLNAFQIALNKFSNISDLYWKESLSIPLIATLFHDFGKSELIREKYLGKEEGKAYKKHAIVSKMYIEEELKHLFKEDLKIINHLLMLVENHHTSNNRMKRDKGLGFIITADHKARKIELDILKENKSDNVSYRDSFNKKILEREDILQINKEKESSSVIYKKIVFKEKTIEVYDNNKVSEMIVFKNIIRVSFNYNLTIFENISTSCNIYLEHGALVSINDISEEDKNKLLNLF